jgi:single-stranded DNA-binding protein
VRMRLARPVSCAATMTLRTKGERDDHSSFIDVNSWSRLARRARQRL